MFDWSKERCRESRGQESMIEHGFNEKTAYGSSYLAPWARVLVVDGKCENREVFREILKDMQVQVDEAENGKDAFDRILDLSLIHI